MRLVARELGFRYGACDVLADVGVELGPGGLVGVIGPNGAGKSTLLRCLYGSLVPTTGAVELDGRPLRSLPRREIARSVAVVPQQGTPAFPVTVEHFVGLGRFAHETWFGAGSPQDRAAVARALDVLGLGSLAQRTTDELSGGEFRRVLIAQALAQQPRLLLLDEPLQQLDLRHQLEVMEFARSFAHSPDSGALIVLHDLGLAARYCDRLILMQAGRVIAEGTPVEVLTTTNVERAFGVHASIELHPVTHAVQVVPLSPSP